LLPGTGERTELPDGGHTTVALLGWSNAFVFGFHPAWLSPSLVASLVLSSDLLSVTRARLLRVVAATSQVTLNGEC
jgi:hypothetical protein